MTAQQRECLREEQVSFYNETGYLVLENHLDMAVIHDIRDEIARLEALALGMTESDDRLDLEDSHTPDMPRVRRIKLPHTQSDVVKKLLYSDQILAPIRDLIGPNLRLHTTKLNMARRLNGIRISLFIRTPMMMCWRWGLLLMIWNPKTAR